jgi:hypothetical protein
MENPKFGLHILNNKDSYGTTKQTMIKKTDHGKKWQIINLKQSLHIYLHKIQDNFLDKNVKLETVL